jgi:hypothetical protein
MMKSEYFELKCCMGGLNIKNTEGSICVMVFVGLNPGIPKLKAWKGKKNSSRAVRQI